MTDNNHATFFQYIQPALQPIVTLFSVWVGFKLKVITDRETKLQKKISDIKEEIDSLCETSITYWSRYVPENYKTGVDLQEECKIKSRNHNINKLIVSMSKNFKSNDYTDINSLVTDLRKASSGENFETNGDREMSPTAIMDTLRCANELKRVIESSLPNKKWWNFSR
ncbi:hypothetical protein [Acetobacter tropicalis]|uniref:Uncharacterized protein n=1 Tax=Acetobacter tropicalis TaxID=104102 RepID=A0A291PJA0_9PROT|nr:hypothetical protein [Acetobacter tropicalis]ATJ91532.1 hypothetical protein CIW82_13345 [Acetobacter tropicalis]